MTTPASPVYHWSSEAEKRSRQRGLSKTLCESFISDSSSQVTLDNSDPPSEHKRVYQRNSQNGKRIHRVIVDRSTTPWTIVTVLHTTNLNNYWDKNVANCMVQQRTALNPIPITVVLLQVTVHGDTVGWCLVMASGILCSTAARSMLSIVQQ